MSLPASDLTKQPDNRTTMELGEVLPRTAEVRDDHLFVGGVDMVELAHEMGTALYVMDEADMRSRMEEYREAVVQAAKNALTAAENKLEEGEKLVQILSITVYVNAEEGFTSQSKVADMASEYFCEVLGEAGVGSRAAVGVASLPGSAPVEISITAAADRA